MALSRPPPALTPPRPPMDMLRFALGGLGLLSLTPTISAQFSYDASALPAQSLWTDGIALADVDGDGDLDILFANGSGYGAGGALAQHLFLNDGTGNFSAAHGQLNVGNFNAKMVIAEDFDNDGDPDLMYAPEGAWPTTTQRGRLLINDGTGNFSDESAARLPDVTMASFCVCAGDVDDDGDLDVVFTDGGTFSGVASQAHLFLNDGDAFFSDGTETNLPDDLYNAQDVTIFDWDGDFDVDIALSGKGQSGKRSRLWLNDGTGNFAISTLLDGVGSNGTYEIEWGDLDNDLSLDGMIVSLSGFNDGYATNSISSVATASFAAPNGDDDNEMAGLDYDDDGDLDVVIGSLGFGGEKLYRNDGAGSFVNVSSDVQSIGDSTLDIAVGDLDGDGDYDLVSGQGESGGFTNRVYDNTGVADTRAPRILDWVRPAFDPTQTLFHARTQDAVCDDGGDGYVVATHVSWQASSTASSHASGEAFHQGGGLWRAALPSVPGATGAVFCWSFTDAQGNASTQALTSGTVADITDLGQALAGTPGLALLGASGTPTPGSPITFSLSNAEPNRAGVFLIGTRSIYVDFVGGTLVPLPRFVIGYVTDGGGNAATTVNWPASAPDCTVGFVQCLSVDPGAVMGFSLSNGLGIVQR
ncbi:MAG: hypothetical protein CMJ89_04920 [Planctomycetes bacterium]|nr:hypothetical protein [Planctomycetota bacterium]